MRKQLSVKSTGDRTHSMSHTSNRDDVSWSSSDGSTYYSEDEVSLKLREHKGPASCRKKKDNQLSADVKSSDIKTETQSPPKYRQEKYPRNSNFRQRKGTRRPPSTSPKNEKITRRPPSTSPKNERRSLLDNVESFPGINVATGSEDVSAIGFLSTEDTAGVFCTTGIPFEVTASKKLYEKVSGLSSSSSSDGSSESSSDDSCDDSSDDSSNDSTYDSRDGSSDDSSDDSSYQESGTLESKFVKWTASTSDCTTSRTHTSSNFGGETSVPTIDQHSVDVVSPSYQDPVSSIECESSSDKSSIGSNATSDKKGAAYEKRLQSTKKSSVHVRETVTSQQIDSKVNKIKEIERKKSELTTDERIKQLKAKIKSIQESRSSTNISTSSTEVDSYVSNLQRIKDNRTASHEDKTETTEPSVQQQINSLPPKDINRQSLQESVQCTDKSLVGTMIPVIEGEGEDISILKFDVSARNVEDDDIETGRTGNKKGIEQRSSIASHTRGLLAHGKMKAIELYDYLLPIIQRNKKEFQRKPRYEQILIIAIVSLFFIFVILLFVMLSQKKNAA